MRNGVSVNHAAARETARSVLSSCPSPGRADVRLARAYLDLHEKMTALLGRTLVRVDEALADFDLAARAARESEAGRD